MSTSNFIQYNVSRNGRHYFRTDKYIGFDIPADFEQILAAKFPADEGFKITKSEQPNSFLSTDIHIIQLRDSSGAAKGYLCTNRKTWFVTHDKDKAQAFSHNRAQDRAGRYNSMNAGGALTAYVVRHDEEK